MLSFIKDKKNCTGCTACMAVCPIDCIKMIPDDEGFLYPSINHHCIECGKCERVCPIASERTQRFSDIDQHAYAGISKDEHVWINSSSGGAFTEICNSFGDEATIIFGSKLREKAVEHSYVVGVENISEFRRSKYVQSYLGMCFREVETFLKQGEKVVFAGTPCQVAGLRSYLKKDYEQLLCIDLICHGVGSPRVFQEYLNYRSMQRGVDIKSYSFRHKRSFMGNIKLYVSRIEYVDGKIEYINKDDYNRLFLSQLCLRKSCGPNCRFRNRNRMGDITLADFKNKHRVFPWLYDYRNYSTIIVNSRIGENIIPRLKERMDLLPCGIDAIGKYNPLFCRTTEGNPLRDDFFSDFKSGVPFAELIEKYLPNKSFRHVHIKESIPYNMRLFIIRVFGRFIRE